MPALEAVQAVDDGELMMMPPTYLTCLEVGQHADPDGVLAASADRSIDMFTPELTGEDDEATLSMPDRLRPLVEERLGR
jgi:hypothetical protein